MHRIGMVDHYDLSPSCYIIVISALSAIVSDMPNPSSQDCMVRIIRSLPEVGQQAIREKWRV